MVSEELILPFYLWILVIVINFVCGIILLKRTFKIDIEVTKKYYGGITLVCFTHGIARIFYFIYDFIFPTELLWWTLGAFVGIICMVIFIFVVETTIYTKTKHFFTIFGLIGLGLIVVDMIFQLNLTHIIQIVVGLIIALIIVIIYLYVTIKSDGIVRKAFIIMIIGIIFLLLGQIGHTPTAHELFPWTVFVAPIMMLLSFILFYISMTLYYLK